MPRIASHLVMAGQSVVNIHKTTTWKRLAISLWMVRWIQRHEYFLFSMNLSCNPFTNLLNQLYKIPITCFMWLYNFLVFLKGLNNNKVSNKDARFYLPLIYVKFKRKFDINILHVLTKIVLMEYLGFRISD